MNASNLKRYLERDEVATDERDCTDQPLEAEAANEIVQFFHSLTKLQRRLFATTHGFKVYDVPALPSGDSRMKPDVVYSTKGDGNCFFRAVSYIITGSECQHKAVRDLVVQHMQTSDHLETYFNQHMGEYLSSSNMSQYGVWATDTELLGCASLLNCDIIVYAQSASSGFKWLRYPASLSLDDPSPNCLLLINRSEHFNVVVTLC